MSEPVTTRLVRLSPPEVHYAMALATQREACKGGAPGNRLNKRITVFGTHFAGVLGELCFRKVYGGRINLAVLPDGDHHQPDVILPDGRGVEVKSSLYSGRDVELKFSEEEAKAIEFCSLVEVAMPDTGTVFPIWSWDYISKRLIEKDYGYGPRLVFQPMGEGGER